jgi:hypothetical protein
MLTEALSAAEHHRKLVIVVPRPTAGTVAAGVAGEIVGSLLGQWLARRGPDEWERTARAEAEAAARPVKVEPVVEYVKPEPVTFEIRANAPDAEIFVDFKSIGTAPQTVMLSPGSHFVMVRAEGFLDWKRDIEPAQNVDVQANLKTAKPDVNVITVR